MEEFELCSTEHHINNNERIINMLNYKYKKD